MLKLYQDIFYICLLLLSNLLLTACSVVHTLSDSAKSQTAAVWLNHQQLVSQLTSYQTRGAFAYISSQQKIYARFNWQQASADSYRLILTNTLGSMVLDLNVQQDIVKIINNYGKEYISADPEAMLHNLSGISIPLNNLRQWMLGLPGDATDFILDSSGHLHRLNYTHNNQLWIVTYQGYYKDNLPALPSNLELRQGDNLLIKLKMDIWSL